MLVLTRRISEYFMMGDDMKICILDIKGCHVRLGIYAPPEIKIWRSELYERIRYEKMKEVEKC